MSKNGTDKNWFKRHKVLTIVLGVILLLVMTSVIFGETPEKTTTSNANGEQTAVSKKDGYRFNERADKQEGDAEIVVGESATVDSLKLTVSQAKKTATLGEFSNATSGKTFIVANVTIENTSKESKPYNVFDFRIQTNGGQVLDPSFENQEPALNSGDLVAGGKVTGNIVFEAPIENAPQYIIWKPNAWKSDRAVVQIQ